jgi:hypothetical protein
LISFPPQRNTSLALNDKDYVVNWYSNESKRTTKMNFM